MGEEIDLRAYIEVLLRHWKWIAGLAVLAAVVAFVVSSLLPATYEASAVVLVTKPRYQLQFDTRFTTDDAPPAYKAFPILATSDAVLQQVVDSYTPSTAAEIEHWNLETLKEMVSASSEGDPSLVLLKVKSRSPDDAAAIANTWANVLTTTGNELYGGKRRDLLFFQEQMAEAKEALDDAEAALIEFQARDQSSILEAQLGSARQTQASYLASQRKILLIKEDIQALQAQLSEQPADQEASLADSLTALLLQIKAFNAQSGTPIQLQIQSGEALSTKSTAEQMAFLKNLLTTLEAQSAEVAERLTELEPQILALQQELQQARIEENQLNRARDLAQETYLTLARKLAEARITAQESNGVLLVGSYAAVPAKPVGPRRLFNTAVAGMLGLMIGVFAAFAIEFWRQPEAAREHGADES